MKMLKNPHGNGYLVSENVQPIAVVPSINNAQRVMGIEPSPEDYRPSLSLNGIQARAAASSDPHELYWLYLDNGLM
ncbi:MAG: hypothetical protein KME42_13810 [Tildeniella nuda ZEHNDER 1965/U140]|jgi:hypothetical protein|nr:hypothetical protein [Tildeniella nuda ZEHNDER 1965/U140]